MLRGTQFVVGTQTSATAIYCCTSEDGERCSCSVTTTNTDQNELRDVYFLGILYSDSSM